MASKLVRQLISGSLTGMIVKVFDAGTKFFTIPILVSYFGKSDYGLFALAVSLNTYLQIMDLGMNVGSIRYFSIWIAQKDYTKLSKVSQSSILFYGVIGAINALIILYLAYHPSILDIRENQATEYFYIMIILASSVVFNWLSNVITQLLTANGQLSDVNKSLLIANVLNIIGVIVTIQGQLPLSAYFLFYSLSYLLIIPLNIIKLKKLPVSIIELFTPKWNWNPFKEIVTYSLVIFAMGIFQFSANHLRPIILARQADGETAILTDYRVIQTLAGLVIAFGSVILQVLIPTVSKLYAENNQEKIQRIMMDGTKLTTLFIGFFCFALISCSRELLIVYMGESYSYLAVWLNLWLITVLLAMHNTPVSSLVLASGKTKVLAYITALGCLLSLFSTYILAEEYMVGAAVIGYFLYVLFVIVSYYIYYTPKVLKLPSFTLFTQSVLPGVIVCVSSWIVVYLSDDLIKSFIDNVWAELVIKGVLFFIIFLLLTLKFIFPISKIKELVLSLKSV